MSADNHHQLIIQWGSAERRALEAEAAELRLIADRLFAELRAQYPEK